MSQEKNGRHTKRIIGLTFISVSIVLSGLASLYLYFKPTLPGTFNTTELKIVVEERDIYITFLDEIYDKIQENYWDEINDEDLSALYKLGSEKITKFSKTLETEDRDGVNKMVSGIIDSMDEEDKKEFVVKLSNTVLLNLNPPDRSSLYTTDEYISEFISFSKFASLGNKNFSGIRKEIIK